jgi:hypothetical protein
MSVGMAYPLLLGIKTCTKRAWMSVFPSWRTSENAVNAKFAEFTFYELR